VTSRAATALLFALTAVLVAAPAEAQERGCIAVVDGVDISQYRSWRHPLRVDDGDVIHVAGVAPSPVTVVRAELVLPLVSAEVWHATTRRPGTSWDGDVPIDDLARLSNGLHQIRIVAGDCTATVWLDVSGGSALATPLSIAGIVLVVAGIGGLALALRGGAAGRRSALRGALSGALVGAGALLLAHQLGKIPLTGEWVVTWLVAPALIGAVLNVAVGSQPASRPPAGAGRTAPPARDADWTTDSSPTPMPAPSSAPPPPPRSRGRGWRRGGTTRAEPPRAEPPPDTAMAEPPADAGFNIGPGAPVGADRGEVGGRSEDRDPPRTSFARIEAPDAAVVGVPFQATVGLSPIPVQGVAGGEVVRPPTSVGAYDLAVQIIADGFSIADDDARRILRVTADAPYPSYSPMLTPLAADTDIAARSIQVIYSVDGQTIGFGVRPIAVVARADLVSSAPAVPAAEPGAMGVPVPESAADVTIRIVRGVDHPGRLLWTVESPHADVPVPAQAAVSDIGDEPATFARKLVAGVAQFDNTEGIDEYLRGVGLTVADHVPVDITNAISAAATAAGDRPVSVFLLSEEPYVPWELAILDPPLRDGAPYLAAQVELGRWVLGQRRPTLPAPLEVDVHSMAVIGGVYEGAAQRLFEAEAEAKALEEQWAAVAVDARTGAIIDCLGGTPEADVLHFAVHGVYDSTSVKEGLVLLDGSLLDPLQVKGARVRGAPFVFLNACQVGSGNELLGDYAGVAASFLYAGAAAVIAPLWSVSDALARELAVAFYSSTLGEGVRPAAVLREARASFEEVPGRPAAATHLAYQLFGHPRLTLRREAP
jgi:hypothetical protein